MIVDMRTTLFICSSTIRPSANELKICHNVKMLIKIPRRGFNNLKSVIIGGFVAICMVGMQFFGVVHQVSHHTYLKTASPYTDVIGHDSSFGHSSSKDCQLFDGLALSGFAASALFALTLLNKFPTELQRVQASFALKPLITPYSSRAPPQL